MTQLYKFIGLFLGISVVPSGGCSSKDSCVPIVTQVCKEKDGKYYLYTGGGCGQPDKLIQECPCGCDKYNTDCKPDCIPCVFEGEKRCISAENDGNGAVFEVDTCGELADSWSEPCQCGCADDQE